MFGTTTVALDLMNASTSYGKIDVANSAERKGRPLPTLAACGGGGGARARNGGNITLYSNFARKWGGGNSEQGVTAKQYGIYALLLTVTAGDLHSLLNYTSDRGTRGLPTSFCWGGTFRLSGALSRCRWLA